MPTAGAGGRLADMNDNDKPIVIYATFPDRDLAMTIAHALVDQRLAACVNLLGPMTSVYRWEGAVENAEETVGLIKTRSSLAERVVNAVREQHPYSNPALMVFPVEGGSEDFLSWILSETS